MVQSHQGKAASSVQKSDASLKASVEDAIWNDEVLRAIEYYEIDVHAHKGIVYLDGHIANTTSRIRIENAVRSVQGIVGVQNRLVPDDRLTLEVAGELGTLEHAHGCKFFTGSSHGVISISGIVSSENVKWLAERCAAKNPDVRAVINHVRVSGATGPVVEDLPFLQPRIGETIYFLDGPSGIVDKVIINPNNRRVMAMLLLVSFTDQYLSVPLVHVNMSAIRYLTKTSGFLLINSHERSRFQNFNPTLFFTPGAEWAPPYPYCHQDVLFLIDHSTIDNQTTDVIHPFAEVLVDTSFKKTFFGPDELGNASK